MQRLTPPNLETPRDHMPPQPRRMFASDLLYELSVRLPIEPQEIVHVLQFRLVSHVGWDATRERAPRQGKVTFVKSIRTVGKRRPGSLSLDRVRRRLLDLVDQIDLVSRLVRIDIRRSDRRGRSVLSVRPVEKVPTRWNGVVLEVRDHHGRSLASMNEVVVVRARGTDVLALR
jgi:hypothetical protein